MTSTDTEEALAKYKTEVASADEERTPEEAEASLKWLREHGVEVESREDREASAELAMYENLLTLDTPGTRAFSYVLLPADDDMPITECVAVVYADERGAGDQLKRLLGPVFTKGLVDAEALKHSNLLNLTQQAGDESLLDKVTPAAISAQGGAAEAFRLNDSVNMYLDEIGALKKLPHNKRGAKLAAQCGYGTGVSFCGDLYVGRFVDQHNQSFTVDELAPDSTWLLTAAQENLAHQANDGRVGGMSAEDMATQGGSGDGYTWKQDGEEVEVTVPMVSGTRGKEVKVSFKSDSVKISVPSRDNFELTLDLYTRVSVDDCTWSLSDNNLVLTMEKATSDETWPALVKA